jgi:hypothetical protein
VVITGHGGHGGSGGSGGGGQSTSSPSAPAATPGGVAGLSVVPGDPAAPTGPSSTSTVLGPVPLVVPLVGGVVGQVSAALPWKWFGLLAIIDMGLIGLIVVRRRRAREAALMPAYAVSEDVGAPEVVDD